MTLQENEGKKMGLSSHRMSMQSLNKSTKAKLPKSIHSPTKHSPARTLSQELYSESQGSPISPVVFKTQTRKYANLGDSPTGLQMVIDQYSPFRNKSFQNNYIFKKKQPLEPVENVYMRKETFG